MLNGIIKWSLQNRLLIVAISALLLVWGTYVAINLPVDVFPDLNRPTVTILKPGGRREDYYEKIQPNPPTRGEFCRLRGTTASREGAEN